MKIVNIVAVATMKEPFDLDMLLKKLKNTEKASVWVKMRLMPENYYIAFYGSGKFLITGIKDLEIINIISKRVIKLLQDAGIDNNLVNVEIKNIVLTDEIKLENSLNEIIMALDTTSASFEPETFPGLFYKDDEGISYTLFSSGKIIITGVKEPIVAAKSLKKFKKLINSSL
ncbi:hypothetical protein [Methanobacterium oryzae]|uniref:hypothetical protein n=1 Tax=Methanobacterium oryzae TaxID=69540 RepID=UPI003D1AF139